MLDEFADLLQEIGVTGGEAMVACGGEEKHVNTIFREWGLSVVRKVAGKMPDIESKISILSEVISMFQGHALSQPQEEVKVENEEYTSEELHTRLIENAKNILSEYLLKKDDLIRKMIISEK